LAGRAAFSEHQAKIRLIEGQKARWVHHFRLTWQLPNSIDLVTDVRINSPGIQKVRHVGEVQARKSQEGRGFLFYLVVLSLLVEFGRPQDVIPGLKLIPFPSLIDLLIGVSVVLSGKLSFAKTQTKLWMALFVVMAIHVPIATNNFWAAITLKDMLLIFLFYLGLTSYVDTVDKLKVILTAWLGVHVILAFTGLMNKGQGVGGWLGDENDFCMEMNVAVPFAYFMALTYKQGPRRVMYLCMLCLFILSAMVSLSRGGFIGLVCVGGYCWLKSSHKGKGVLIVMVVIIFMLIAAPEQYWEEMQSATDEKTMTVGTGAERLYTWGIAWKMFLGNPIIGVGQGNFPWNFEEAQGFDRFNTRSLAGRAAHSMYFTLVPELGLVGTTLFIGMLMANYSSVRRVRALFRRPMRAPLTAPPRANQQHESFAIATSDSLEAAMVGYLASSVFISTLYYPTFWVLTGLAVALENSVRSNDKSSSDYKPQYPVVPKIPPSLRVARSRPLGYSS
jgi:hypothetical protein